MEKLLYFLHSSHTSVECMHEIHKKMKRDKKKIFN